MKKSLISSNFNLLCILTLSIFCFQQSAYSEVVDLKITSPVYAALTEGKIQVKGVIEKEYERSEQIEVIELWHYSPGNSDYRKVVKEKFKGTIQTVISLPQTPYQLILLDGIIQPLILDSKNWILWHIRGLGPYFSKVRRIIPDNRCVTFSGVEGFADFDLIWVFDFSDTQAGLIVEYDSEGGW